MISSGHHPPDGVAHIVSVRLNIGGLEAEVSGYDTRATIREKFDEPWDTGATSRKHQLPAVLVYGSSTRLEFHFETGRGDRLERLFREELGRVVLNVAFAPETTTPAGAMQSIEHACLEGNPRAAAQGEQQCCSCH